MCFTRRSKLFKLVSSFLVQRWLSTWRVWKNSDKKFCYASEQTAGQTQPHDLNAALTSELDPYHAQRVQSFNPKSTEHKKGRKQIVLNNSQNIPFPIYFTWVCPCHACPSFYTYYRKKHFIQNNQKQSSLTQRWEADTLYTGETIVWTDGLGTRPISQSQYYHLPILISRESLWATWELLQMWDTKYR